ncbi:MAG TPA: uroporphyrinogen-III C-methyltransferase [Pseudomonas sp.]|nr:uroporphyrinogen-III C-methyltransferase [Pseudomonas sp.]
MSETDAQSPALPAPAESNEPRPAAGRAALPLAAAALLVALAAAALGGWTFWQGQQLQRQAQAQLAEQQRQQQQWQAAQTEGEQRLAEASQAVEQRLEQLPSQEQLGEQRQLLQTLQGDQQHLAQSLTRLLGASREDWRLAEAEHLLRLAILRLSAMQDLPSAIALVQVADDILRAQNDPLGFAARGEMIKALETLRALPQPDRDGLFLQLAALREQGERLLHQSPHFTGSALEAPEQATEERFWEYAWRKLSPYLRIELNAEQELRPLLAGQNLAQVRLALSLALQQAQWAALNGQPEVYGAALQQAAEVLNGYFDTANPAARSLAQRLAELAEQPVTVETPDLRPALQSLQTYLHQRQQARGEAPAAEPEDAQ